MRAIQPTPLVSGSALRASVMATALVVAGLLASASALAQSGSGNSPAGTPAGAEPPRTLEQRTERIVHEDAGSRIEELRVGGQTRTISVQTNTDVPGYQVQPLDAGRADGGLGQRSGNAGRSTWRLFNF
jgi:hypothetical protein